MTFQDVIAAKRAAAEQEAARILVEYDAMEDKPDIVLLPDYSRFKIKTPPNGRVIEGFKRIAGRKYEQDGWNSFPNRERGRVLQLIKLAFKGEIMLTSGGLMTIEASGFRFAAVRPADE